MKKNQPPRIARKIFEWLAGPAHVEDLLGDLDEWFYLNLQSKSRFAAHWFYWKQVLSLGFSYAIKKRKQQATISVFASSSFSWGIVNNYFKVAARSLYRHKYFSIVNVLGLSIGMSVSLLLITMYVHLCTFDNFHTQKNKIYRILTSYETSERSWELSASPVSLAESINRRFAGVKEIVRINSGFSIEAVSGNLDVPLHGYYTEPSFLNIFDYPLISGNAATALNNPNSLVISASAALKVFNTTDVLGRTVEVKGLGNFEVTGVMAEPPKNSHMDFEVLASYNTLPLSEQTYDGNYKNWADFGRQYVYLLIEDKSAIPGLEKYLASLSGEASKRSGASIDFYLQPLTSITPGKDLTTLTGNLGPQWDTLIFSIFGVICLLILIPACFNYTNISIARALKRSKEIGLRKTMGGLKNQIFFQFITETVVVTAVSLMGSLLIFVFIRQEFKDMLVGGAALDLSITIPIAFAFAGFAIFTGFAAGFFPALHFSRLNPIQALKSQGNRNSSQNRIRKGLTIFQFALSFCFILALVVFSRQYHYSLNYDFGFQREGILDVTLQGVKPDHLKTEFSKLASVNKVSLASHVLGLSYGYIHAGSVNTRDSLEVNQIFVDVNYIPNMKLVLLAGRNFPDELWQHEKYIIVNEQFLKNFNLGTHANALGKLFRVEGQDLEIIGVVKDFHYAPLNRPIEAFFFRVNPSQYAVANLNVTIADNFASLTQMEHAWKTIEREKKFEARFLDDEIRDSYDNYESILKLVGFLGLLAISITLLGLLGMVVYTSEIKTKEVGIRKVMGASISGLTFLLSKDYLRLMLWAAGFAIPVTTLITDTVLASTQRYHVTLSVWDVALSLAILFSLGLVTIASQTFRTASANPADVLRSE